ncbi:MAG: hypothetical protein H0V34_13445, partial [Gammaproteobacteria bacterium]|nr:hypothetical protein [Gammaproteobacteria bacterium]
PPPPPEEPPPPPPPEELLSPNAGDDVGGGGPAVAAVSLSTVSSAAVKPASGTAPLMIEVLRNDTAFRGRLDPATVDIVTQPRNGVAWANANGAVSYVRSNASTKLGDAFYYTVKDDRGRTSNRARVTVLAAGTSGEICRVVSHVGTTAGNLSAGGAQSPGPTLYRLMSDGRSGSVSLRDAVTGQFAYMPHPATHVVSDRFTYEVVGAGQTARWSARLMFESRLMALGGATTAGVIDAARQLPSVAPRVGYRQALKAVLAADDYRVDFVGSRSAGIGLTDIDADHEAHPGWTLTELAYGRRGDGTDGIYGWLTTHPADVVLLQIERGHIADGVAGVFAVLDEIARWEASAGGNHVSVVVTAPVGSLATLPGWKQFSDGLAAMAAGRETTARGPHKVMVIDHALIDMMDSHGVLYPNPAGYRQMAQTWRDALIESTLLRSCR